MNVLKARFRHKHNNIKSTYVFTVEKKTFVRHEKFVYDQLVFLQFSASLCLIMVILKSPFFETINIHCPKINVLNIKKIF